MSDRQRKREQMELLAMAEGFFESRVLTTLVELGVFDAIGERQATAEQVAAAIDADAASLKRLLAAGVVTRLLESDDGEQFSLSPTCRSVLLRSAGPHYLGNWLVNLGYFGKAIDNLAEAIRTGQPTVDLSGDLHVGDETTRTFILAMHDYASLRGSELATFLDTEGCRSLLDVGSGPGTYSFILGAANPDLALYLLDAAEVLEVAKEVHARYDIPNAVTYLPGDARVDPIEGCYDLVLISNTLHMLGEDHARNLLRHLHDHVTPGGSVVVQAQFLREDRMGGRWPVMLDLVQLCLAPHARNHTVTETREWMEDAGFVDVDYCPMTLLNTNSYLRGWRR
jgi:SAM-dependent methyltransferase